MIVEGLENCAIEPGQKIIENQIFLSNEISFHFHFMSFEKIHR